MKCCSDPDSVPVALDFDRGDRGGWAYTDCDDSTPTKRVDTRTYVHDDLTDPWIWSPAGSVEWPSNAIVTTMPFKFGEYLRIVNGTDYHHSTDGVNWTKIDRADVPEPYVMHPLPPEKVEAARKDWPPLWVLSDQKGYRWRHSTAVEQAGDVNFLTIRVPNNAHGRRAAWELEGA